MFGVSNWKPYSLVVGPVLEKCAADDEVAKVVEI